MRCGYATGHLLDPASHLGGTHGSPHSWTSHSQCGHGARTLKQENTTGDLNWTLAGDKHLYAKTTPILPITISEIVSMISWHFTGSYCAPAKPTPTKLILPTKIPFVIRGSLTTRFMYIFLKYITNIGRVNFVFSRFYNLWFEVTGPKGLICLCSFGEHVANDLDATISSICKLWASLNGSWDKCLRFSRYKVSINGLQTSLLQNTDVTIIQFWRD